jgi:hypothetical protein
MPSLTSKLVIGAAVVALGAALSATPAEAFYDSQRCNDYGCYRVRCNDDGDRCTRLSSYSESEYVAPPVYVPPRDAAYAHSAARYLCDADGDDCRWTHIYRDDPDDY